MDQPDSLRMLASLSEENREKVLQILTQVRVCLFLCVCLGACACACVYGGHLSCCVLLL